MRLVQKLIYLNSSGKCIRIFLEPWAEQFQIAPGEGIEILVYTPDEATEGVLEFEQVEGGLIVYGYEGCVINLKSNGNDLTPSDQIG
ncbi:hypothetical protein [Paracidovorax valerianellae]|uniref:hypothetical protein n=1 Tax=Paracidovorax valerianellae TaxID=187868 RepID=UPI001113E2D3|nr:hypothetical protein [Paracidovorax valerianellae]MDA8448049.1 hypothetical protein [Paracidovorax valerianellae]